MKKTIVLLLMVLLVATFCYAQVPREPGSLNQYTPAGTDGSSGRAPGDPRVECFASNNTTAFANLVTTGLNVTGNPSFLSLTNTANITYYLWVDEDGDLLMASHETMWLETEFPSGSWRYIKDGTSGVNTVGEQT